MWSLLLPSNLLKLLVTLLRHCKGLLIKLGGKLQNGWSFYATDDFAAIGCNHSVASHVRVRCATKAVRVKNTVAPSCQWREWSRTVGLVAATVRSFACMPLESRSSQVTVNFHLCRVIKFHWDYTTLLQCHACCSCHEWKLRNPIWIHFNVWFENAKSCVPSVVSLLFKGCKVDWLNELLMLHQTFVHVLPFQTPWNDSHSISCFKS